MRSLTSVRVVTLRTQQQAHSLVPAPLFPRKLSLDFWMSEFTT
jgi:hypothetical protein